MSRRTGQKPEPCIIHNRRDDLLELLYFLELMILLSDGYIDSGQEFLII